MANPGERIMRASCNEDSVVVELADGRTVSAPLAWFPRLLRATPQQRSNCSIAGAGYGMWLAAYSCTPSTATRGSISE